MGKFFGLAGLAVAMGGCATQPVPAAAKPAPQSAVTANLNPSPIKVDARWASYGAYLQRMIDQVQVRWERLLTESKVYPASGTKVVVKFTMNDQGAISKIVSVDGTAGDAGSRACVGAITDRSPYGAWTDAMKADLGKEQELTFQFFYQ